jgi:transcriptional regulator with XRE-family HTH domain
VGSRLKLRRTLLGISQEQLGETVGLSFQQIQKYERGANRISASRLFEFARELKVPVAYFFEGAAAGEEATDDGDRVATLINSPEGVDLACAWTDVQRPAVKRQLLQLIRALGSTDSAS